MTQSEIKERIQAVVTDKFACDAEDATVRQMYESVVTMVVKELSRRRKAGNKKVSEQEAKKVYYMSMEFLIGRSLKNNLYNMGMEEDVRAVLAEMGVDLEQLYEMEPDAGLGNGGLGRLAACYLDSLTACDYPATGFSIRYEFGIFKQVIIDGWQMEFPDNWLELGGGWLVPRPDEAQEIHFDGNVEELWSEDGLKTVHSNYYKVLAIPYDLLISGHDSKIVNKLRLWGAKSMENFDMSLFSRGEYLKSCEGDAKAEAISRVLYPADDHEEGKSLRLRQQYFFVSASLQNILADHLKKYGTLDTLPDKVVVHINDTHPALCVPELMRLLMDDHGYSWDKAWAITCKTLAYTNHTVMSEALEKWSIGLFSARLPRIYTIVQEINRRFCEMVYNKHPEMRHVMDQIAVIGDGMVRMANLCVACCYSVNGVSALHSDILKEDLFKHYHAIFPNKLTNVTNGIVHRRWLCESNPWLTDLIKELIGDGFVGNGADLEKLMAFKDDESVLKRLPEIKRQNKLRLAKYIENSCGIKVSPDSIFDVQAKRLHEYKRQLLCALHIYDLYRRIKYEGLKIHPRTFIFGAKASAGYIMAKEIIRFICALGDMINNDPAIGDMLKVVFLADYKVSLAEILMPAAEVSEQISLAGKEASGTGNMKFMINGALTLGTLDGANVEINQQVGDENMFLFGLTTPEVNRWKADGYHPDQLYRNDPHLREMLDSILRDGIGGKGFESIVRYLIGPDPYMVLADFNSDKDAQAKINEADGDTLKWTGMSLVHIAKAGFFASDRAVREYADNIWNLKPIE
ncbi:MAG: glycogen/starch/alpha-glucan phosphorylase [Clostridia bacterium]|nr:glycogen/starch/alpha-glucan phosphorylase [Clostridia bacterium]